MVEYSLEKINATSETRSGRPGIAREVCSDLASLFVILAIAGSSTLASVLVGEVHSTIKYTGIGLMAGVFTLLALTQGGYMKFERLMESWSSLRGVIWRWGLVALSLVAFAYTMEVADTFSRKWFLIWVVMATGGLIFGRFAFAMALRSLTRDGGVLCRKVAIIGATELAEKFIEKMAVSEIGVQIVGIYDDYADHGPQSRDLAIEGGIEELIRAAENGAIDDVVVCLPAASNEIIDDVFHRLAVLPVNTLLCPGLAWLTRGHASLTHLGNLPMLTVHRRPLEGWGSFVKLVEDKVLSTIALILLAPLMIIIAILVKLDSPGPVFFRQQRHGFNHQVFRIYKFRTMSVMEDSTVVTQAQKNDPRVTKVGAFLRKWSLDEVPQFINVFLGDMSLVGPRPHAIAHNAKYVKIVEDYAGRHKVKPGITGWAQVNGWRGETTEDELMEKRVEFDLTYIENWSLLFDIRILLMTFKAVIIPTNAH